MFGVKRSKELSFVPPVCLLPPSDVVKVHFTVSFIFSPVSGCIFCQGESCLVKHPMRNLSFLSLLYTLLVI